MEKGISDDTILKIIQFTKNRDWDQFHNPKDLALSITLEAAELLECFQWSGSDVEVKDKQVQMKEELADVLVYCILLADKLGVDLDDIIKAKMLQNEQKYPVDKSYGSAKKYDELGD